MANYQWYPGHMTKAKRMMQEDIKLIDLVIELVDARVPFSSRNPDIDELGKNKSRIILLNKSDLADIRKNKLWMDYFSKRGFYVLEMNSKTGAGMKSIQGVVQEACKEKIERDRKRGILNRPVRAMVVGIPNVGKSTFINSFAGKACAKTGNKPGVTKEKQWIRLNKSLDLKEEYAGLLEKRYQIEISEGQEVFDIIKAVCISKRCYLKGEELDIMRASSMIVDDFRNGRIGKITLEMPEE